MDGLPQTSQAEQKEKEGRGTWINPAPCWINPGAFGANWGITSPYCGQTAGTRQHPAKWTPPGVEEDRGRKGTRGEEGGRKGRSDEKDEDDDEIIGFTQTQRRGRRQKKKK